MNKSTKIQTATVTIYGPFLEMQRTEHSALRFLCLLFLQFLDRRSDPANDNRKLRLIESAEPPGTFQDSLLFRRWKYYTSCGWLMILRYWFAIFHWKERAALSSFSCNKLLVSGIKQGRPVRLWLTSTTWNFYNTWFRRFWGANPSLRESGKVDSANKMLWSMLSLVFLLLVALVPRRGRLPRTTALICIDTCKTHYRGWLYAYFYTSSCTWNLARVSSALSLAVTYNHRFLSGYRPSKFSHGFLGSNLKAQRKFETSRFGCISRGCCNRKCYLCSFATTRRYCSAARARGTAVSRSDIVFDRHPKFADVARECNRFSVPRAQIYFWALRDAPRTKIWRIHHFSPSKRRAGCLGGLVSI